MVIKVEIIMELIIAVFQVVPSLVVVAASSVDASVVFPYKLYVESKCVVVLSGFVFVVVIWIEVIASPSVVSEAVSAVITVVTSAVDVMSTVLCSVGVTSVEVFIVMVSLDGVVYRFAVGISVIVVVLGS